MVEIPEILAEIAHGLSGCPREIGAFQVLRPGRFEPVNALVHDLQRIDLRVGEFLFRDGDEIQIAVLIEITHGEGALQVRAYKIAVQGLSVTFEKFTKDRIEFRVS